MSLAGNKKQPKPEFKFGEGDIDIELISFGDDFERERLRCI